MADTASKPNSTAPDPNQEALRRALEQIEFRKNTGLNLIAPLRPGATARTRQDKTDR